jgi:hypothetical protein
MLAKYGRRERDAVTHVTHFLYVAVKTLLPLYRKMRHVRHVRHFDQRDTDSAMPTNGASCFTVATRFPCPFHAIKRDALLGMPAMSRCRS